MTPVSPIAKNKYFMSKKAVKFSDFPLNFKKLKNLKQKISEKYKNIYLLQIPFKEIFSSGNQRNV